MLNCCRCSEKSCHLYTIAMKQELMQCRIIVRQQLNLKEGLVRCKPTCAFAQILPGNTNELEDTITTPFGVVPKGSIQFGV